MQIRTAIILAALLHPGLAPAQTSGGTEHWVATWGTAQLTYRASGRGAAAAAPRPTPPPAASPAQVAGPARRFPIPPSLPGLDNQTVRMIVRTSIGGDTVRVRLANAYGSNAVRIGAAHIAVVAKDSAVAAGTDHVLTFSGQPSAMLYAGQVLVSDPVRLKISSLSDVAVSLYFPETTGPPTSHTFGLRSTYISQTGDFSGAPDIADPAATTESYYWLAGLDVLAPADAGTLVTFGDSITDGDQSTPGAYAMWPAILAARLTANRSTARIGVVNAGIAGNRILGDNNSGLARLMRDALSVPGVKWISLLEGINDITGATRNGQAGFGAGDLIAAYRQVIDSAHLHGVKVIGCTLTPFGGSNVFTERGEAIRTAANEWIRNSRAFDAVVDFDAATRDRQDPRQFRAEADSPDMLHPGDAGYKIMAAAFDPAIFSSRPRPAAKKKSK